MGKTRIGISGWTYEGWRGEFYPKGLAHKKELSYASREFSTIEINGTFYGLQKPKTYQDWYERTPPGFVFSVKANQYITHVRRLRDIEKPLATFLSSGPLALKEKLGPFLWQFPPSMSFDPDRFKTFLELLPHRISEYKKLCKKSELPQESQFLKGEASQVIRHAVEVRNDSFLNPWFIEMLREHNVALVLAETAGKWPYFEDITTDFLYLRLHGDSEIYVSGHDEASIEFWAKRIKSWSSGTEPRDRLTLTEDKARKISRDVYIYFDNDLKVKAPRDAKSLSSYLKIWPPPRGPSFPL